MAFKYLGRAMVPLMIAYSVYSLLYHEHRGWYSFVVGVMAGGVYTFGKVILVMLWMTTIPLIRLLLFSN